MREDNVTAHTCHITALFKNILILHRFCNLRNYFVVFVEMFDIGAEVQSNGVECR